ncbi:MAG: hypothetical protein WAL56_17690, partial [Candidatus Sulfotelmatobacter sp.]
MAPTAARTSGSNQDVGIERESQSRLLRTAVVASSISASDSGIVAESRRHPAPLQGIFGEVSRQFRRRLLGDVGADGVHIHG